MGSEPLPATIGPYHVAGKVSEGGMGLVYKARDEKLDRIVALKVLLPGKADAEHRARFLREARAAAGISHPNVVQVHATGEDGDVAWLAIRDVRHESS